MVRRAAPPPAPEPDPAPNLRGRYPLGGERIGPAWRETWRVLGEGDWVQMRTLCHDVAPRHGLSPQALAAVVTTARRVAAGRPGRLESRQGDDKLIHVRRADRPVPSSQEPT